MITTHLGLGPYERVLQVRALIRYVDVETAQQLRDAVQATFPGTDAVIMAAAVADFRPAAPVEDKISKTGLDGLTVEMEPTPDVLSELAETRRPGQIVVGFAAEHGQESEKRGRSKLERKHLDAVVVNDISRADIGFDVEQNEVTVVTADGAERVPRASKARVAAAVLDAVELLRTRTGEAQRS